MKNYRRILMMLIGIIFTGMGDGFIKAAYLGTDPFTGAMTGISYVLRMGYGNTFVIVSIIMFLIVWKLDSHYIGVATVIGLFGMGYITQYTAEFVSRFTEGGGFVPMIISFAIGLFILCLGSALYFTADMGVSTYDALSLIMRDKGKHTLKFYRVGTDLICVVIALVFGATIGIGTVVTAFCLGPVIELFNHIIAEPLLYGNKQKSAVV